MSRCASAPSDQAAWESLPIFAVPVVGRPDPGRTATVLRVGFAEPFAPLTPARDTTPWVLVRDGGGDAYFRLPAGLAFWAECLLGLENLGGRPFPGRYEFGVSRGRCWVEVVVGGNTWQPHGSADEPVIVSRQRSTPRAG